MGQNLGITKAPGFVDDVTAIAPEIALRNVTRTFETDGGIRVEALRGMSLTIAQGEFVAVRGQSGCGKSSLLNILGCLDRPSGGTYWIAGQNADQLDANELAYLRRRAFGFVFQNYNLLPNATALENVEIPAVYAGTSSAARRDRALHLLTSLGLGSRLDHRPSQLSGGEQQRVSIARALMNGGRVILADEPTGALDSKSSKEIIDLLGDLARQGHTVIVVTHDPEVAKHADRQITMLDGRIVSDSGNADISSEARSSHMAIGRTPIKDIQGGASLADVLEATRMAIRSLRASPFRTFLTLLGVVIGVAAIVALLAIGEGAKQRMAEEINALGANRLSVWANTHAYPGATLTFSDAQDVAERVDNIRAVLPTISGNSTVRIGNRDYTATVNATTAEFPVVRNWPLASGIFFDEADSHSLAAVAVLGAAVLENLFPDGNNPLGAYVLIDKVPFLVIGTMTRKGAAGFANRDQDDVVLVPLMTGARRLFGRSSLQAMTVSVEDSSLIDQTEADVRSTLVALHGLDDVRIQNSAEMQENMAEAMTTATLILGAIAAISLLVGGIGVMNIMLVSVTERTREIGIRIATGARRSDILVQFIVEAMVVTGIGGLIGLGTGLAIGLLTTLAFPEVRTAFTLVPMIVALVCATSIGLIFGIAPARKAASLDPVVALSSE